MKKLSLAVFALILSACVTTDDRSRITSIPVPSASSWDMRPMPHMAEAMEFFYKTPGGSFMVMCAQGTCAAAVEPASGCTPGNKYPLLVNSEKNTGIIPAQCAPIPGADGKARTIAVFSHGNEMVLKAVMAGNDISVAFPTGPGGMDVISVDMKGARELLQPFMDAGTKPRKPLKGERAA